VLNAGIGERGDYMDASVSTAALEKTLDVDLRAVVSGARLIAQLMVHGGRGGRILTLASAAGAQQPIFCACFCSMQSSTRLGVLGTGMSVCAGAAALSPAVNK
jgi:short-subunit dehydrogenase